MPLSSRTTPAPRTRGSRQRAQTGSPAGTPNPTATAAKISLPWQHAAARIALLSCAIALGLVPHTRAEQDNESLESLPPKAFLQEVRRPLRQDAWGEVAGRIIYSDKNGRQKGNVRIRMAFSPKAMHAQIVLNETNVYAFEQQHTAGTQPKTQLDLPEKETKPRLFDFGVKPEDLTFAFIYWTFKKEQPKDSFRHRTCRVIDLRKPDGKGIVRVWFHAEHGFPMQAKWFHEGQETPWRTLELKGAKKHDDDLWFVKEMRLEGDDWKTKVRFDHAEINRLGQKGTPEKDEKQ